MTRPLWKPRRWGWLAGLCLLGGCCFPVREKTDQVVCELAARPLDVQPITPGREGRPADGEGTLPAPRSAEDRLRIPPEFPGAETPALQLPTENQATRREREQAIDRVFSNLPRVGRQPEPGAGPEGRPLTLSDLQRLALANSPLIRQAAADVEGARGTALQAGLPPNPNFGYEADTMATGGAAGYQGGYLEQVLVTGGKLEVAKAVAQMDVVNAEVALRAAQVDLAAKVRATFFNLLLARETVRVARAVVRFTDEVYGVELDQLKAAQVAAYEPLTFRVQSLQARNFLVRAHNRYLTYWKQLAAALGLPGMPLTEIEGSLEIPWPHFDYPALLDHVLKNHTDVRKAQNDLKKSRLQLRQAQLTPIPNIDLRVMLQKDYTTPTELLAPSVMIGVPVPVWDRNQGNIIQAQAGLLRACEEQHQARSDLTQRLADAFGRYDSARQVVESYRRQILPDLVRVYRGVYQRFQTDPKNLNFNDVALAQENLGQAVEDYLTALGDLWSAVVDVAALLQTDDVFHGTVPDHPPILADLEGLFALPCRHPCSPIPDPQFKGGDGNWPGILGPSISPSPPAPSP